MLARLQALSRLRLVPAFIHVMQKVLTLTIGPIVVSSPARFLRSLADSPSPLPLPVRVAVTAHAYYPELIPEILRCRSFVSADAPVFLTVPPDKMQAAESFTQGLPNISLTSAPNRGRDIAPFLGLLQSGVFDEFDVVLKLHTKRSPHLLDGETRRKLLFDALCGSRRGVRRTLEAFLNPRVGMAGWRACFRRSPSYWMANRLRVENLAAKLDLSNAVKLGFFEGSMFWFRPAALSPLRSTSLQADEFESEAGQVDGTLHHALERLFTIAAWAGGFTVTDLQGRELTGTLPLPWKSPVGPR